MNQERRRHPRYPVKIPIKTKSPAGEEITISAANISLTGVYCHSSHFIPEMTQMRLQVELPFSAGSEFISADGVVVRVEPDEPSPETENYRFALFFTSISPEDREKLKHYLEEHVKL